MTMKNWKVLSVKGEEIKMLESVFEFLYNFGLNEEEVYEVVLYIQTLCGHVTLISHQDNHHEMHDSKKNSACGVSLEKLLGYESTEKTEVDVENLKHKDVMKLEVEANTSNHKVSSCGVGLHKMHNDNSHNHNQEEKRKQVKSHDVASSGHCGIGNNEAKHNEEKVEKKSKAKVEKEVEKKVEKKSQPKKHQFCSAGISDE